jgi:hypothetical protein
MIFRAITGDNDWTFGRGIGSYFTANDAIMADVKTALQFFLNDCFFAMDTGIDWWNLLGAKNPAARNNIILRCRETIIKREGVLRVNKVTASVDPTTRKLLVEYNIDTIYTQSVTSSVQLP